ncbi:hypothetical protein D3C76_1677120 [compost metagenome]
MFRNRYLKQITALLNLLRALVLLTHGVLVLLAPAAPCAVANAIHALPQSSTIEP